MYSRYLQYTDSAVKAHQAAIVENQAKDVVINNLKTDLYQLRQLQGDYLRLNDQITALQDKYSLLLAEKQRTEKEQRSKSDIDKASIIELRQDIDALKIQLQRVSVEIEEVLRQNTALKRMSEARANQIQTIITKNRDLDGKNQRQNQENRNLSFNIKALKQQRKKLEDDCDALSNLLDSNIAKLKALQRNARGVESNNARLDKTLLQAQNDNTKLTAELKQTDDDVKKNEAKLKDLATNIDQLKITYGSLQIQSNKNRTDSLNNQANLQNETNRGKQLMIKLDTVQNAIKGRQNQLDKIGAQEQRLRKEHFNRIDQNKILNSQIDRILSIIAEYEQVNRELIQQIEIYIDEDAQARAILDRKQNMKELIQRNISRVQSTNEAIKHLKY